MGVYHFYNPTHIKTISTKHVFRFKRSIKEFNKGEDKVYIGLKVDMKKRELTVFVDDEEVGIIYKNLPDKIMPVLYLETKKTGDCNICSIQKSNL